MIVCRMVIGFGSPEQGTAKVHGEPIGEAGLAAAKDALGWPVEPAFHVPDLVREHMGRAALRGGRAEQAWREKLAAYARAYPTEARRLEKQLKGELPEDWDAGLFGLFPPETPPMASREASGKVLNALSGRVHGLFGGSVDLAPSTKTTLTGQGDFAKGRHDKRNIHFGVREHAMGAIVNGMALHGGLIPFGATFLQFADYMRAPMRLAALMGIRSVYVFTHDSIGLGEDGPTHQHVEHLLTLPAVPNLTVIRPGDARETVEAWSAALLNTGGPTALALSRQNLPWLSEDNGRRWEGLQRGAYVLWHSNDDEPEVILIGTGSEVQLASEAGRTLAHEGIRVRVVSMPSWELFDRRPAAYRESVLPSRVRTRISVEAGTTLGWERCVGFDGEAIGIDRYGAGAPAGELYEEYGITADAVAEAARRGLSQAVDI